MPVVDAVQFGALTHQSVRTCPIQAHTIVDSPPVVPQSITDPEA